MSNKQSVILINKVAIFVLTTLIIIVAYKTVSVNINDDISKSSIIISTTEIASTESTTELTTENETTTNSNTQIISLGTFQITYYCPCEICNGGYNFTAMGTPIIPYYSMAVDPDIIPLGSKIMIDGEAYVAEGTGSAIQGNRIDFCVSTHEEALERGVSYAEVFLVLEN